MNQWYMELVMMFMNGLWSLWMVVLVNEVELAICIYEWLC